MTAWKFPYNISSLLTYTGDKRVEVDLLPGAATIEPKNYTVRVVTGNKTGSGTDANVFLTMIGENGESPEFPLKDSQNRNKFERDQTDTFQLNTPDLGQVYKISIRHDNAGLLNADWFLDRVEVENDEWTEPAIFHCERWLAKVFILFLLKKFS